tara:strand:- start:2618 stop:3460 length:843 start_codon:yes stop_codon:yes gene_type:complete
LSISKIHTKKSTINFVIKPNLYPYNFEEEYGFKIKINSFPSLKNIKVLNFPASKNLILKAQSNINKNKNSQILNIVNYKINLEKIIPDLDVWVEYEEDVKDPFNEEILQKYYQAIYKLLEEENVGHLVYYKILLEEFQNVIDSINLFLKTQMELQIKFPDKCLNLNDVNKSIAELKDCYEIDIENQRLNYENLQNEIEINKSYHRLDNMKFIVDVTKERYDYYKKNSFYSISVKKIMNRNDRQKSFYIFLIFINVLTNITFIILYFLYWHHRNNKFEKSL